MSNLILIHGIGNTYGGMRVYTRDGKFFWDNEDYDPPALDERGNETLDGSEIPESLYKELLAHYHKDKPERDREEAIQEAPRSPEERRELARDIDKAFESLRESAMGKSQILTDWAEKNIAAGVDVVYFDCTAEGDDDE